MPLFAVLPPLAYPGTKFSPKIAIRGIFRGRFSGTFSQKSAATVKFPKGGRKIFQSDDCDPGKKKGANMRAATRHPPKDFTYTSKTPISAGETPDILLACPIVDGANFSSFWRASSRRPTALE